MISEADGADWADREAFESRQTSWLSIILKAEFWIMRIIAYFCLLIYKVPAKRR